jgi:palmitoyltransferase
MTETIFFFLIVMCAIMGFTLFIFVFYHFFLIYKGQTTNERVKKNDEIDYYAK